MMSDKCSVVGCNTNNDTKIERTQKNSPVYLFPKDEVLRSKWFEILGIPDNYKITRTSKVCAKHFDKKYFVTNEIGNVVLSSNAIPNSWSSAKPYEQEQTYKFVVQARREAVDRIQNFEDLCAALQKMTFPNWNLFNQTDGICFFRLSIDENFNDVNFAMKILINKDMRVKIYSNDMEAKNEELDWILNECQLQLWSQFEAILDNYQQETEITFKASPLNHFKSAQKYMQKIIDTIEVTETIQMIYDELDMLIKNEIPEEDFYHKDINEINDQSDEPLDFESNIVTTIKNEHVAIKDEEELIELIEGPESEQDNNIEYDEEIIDETEIETMTDCDLNIEILHHMKVEMVDENIDVNTDEEFHEHTYSKSLSENETSVAIDPDTSIKNSRSFKCEKCPMLFQSQKKWSLHMGTHNSTKASTIHVCHICGKNFQASKNLNAHILTHTPSSKVTCPKCGIVLNKSALSKHIKTIHENKKDHKCKYCGKGFADITGCKIHEKVHEKQPENDGFIIEDGEASQFQCADCKRAFHEQRDLNKHIKRGCAVDAGKRRKYSYNCHECCKKFITKLLAQKHLKDDHQIDIKNINIYCFECHAEFNDYINHIKIHSSKFVCSKCGIRFITEGRMLEHQKTKHSEHENRPHACDTCELTFKTENHLRSHKTVMHSKTGKKFQCDDCNARFHFKAELTAHMRMHSNVFIFKCPICERPFKYMSQMKKHARNEHGTDLIYQCDNCDERYKTLILLKNHRQQVHGITMNVQKYFGDSHAAAQDWSLC